MARKPKPTETPEQAIGARIAAARKRQAITQRELAERLDTSQAVLSRYESGVIRLHGALVAEIAKALQASADELLGLKPPSLDGVLHDRRFVRRLQEVERLPKRRKQALLMTLDSVLEARSNNSTRRPAQPAA